MSRPPLDEYRERLKQRTAEHHRLERLHGRYAAARLTVFAVAALLAALAFTGWLTAWSLVIPAVAFVVLIKRHDRVLRARQAASRAIVFYERGLARLEDRWVGTGEPGDRFVDDHHLYANDLDLFGKGSLFELLSIARTRAGEQTLASWLTTAADGGAVRVRQEAVDELTPALDLREALFQAGSDVRAGVDGDALVRWAEAPPSLGPPLLRAVAIALTAGTLASVAFAAVTGDTAWLTAMLVLQAVFVAPQRKRLDRALHAAGGVARDLDVLGHVLERLERERFKAPSLVTLREALDTHGTPASRAIGRLGRLVEMHDWQHNMVFLLISLALMWGTHLAWAIEAWRREYGSHIRGWLDAVGELEALSSLSAYRYEHPADPFPVFIEGANAPGASGVFEGSGLGHPLLPASRMVANDVHLSGDIRLLVVSGSNMSGKSTLLRTVGINVVLAGAGAPVRAASLRLSPLRVGATLRIQDSLQEGRSRFYAEITRLREVSDVARGPVPLLFLLDELFHGTNSHDRLVGASGLLRSLIEHGAIGLITTHDLALAGIADRLAPRAANVHFDDVFQAGNIVFDYRVKPGPVTRSNAIALMKSVGLDVD